MKAAPVSRRARPAKAPLSRDIVIETGLRILDSEGSGALTMRRVAQELDTGAASLYVYVANRDDLMTGMLDHVLAAVPTPTVGDWRTRLETLVASAVDALARHEGLALVAFGRSTGRALGLIEQLLGLLREGGLDAASAAWGVDLLYPHITAAAAERAVYDDSAVARRLADLPARRYPNITAVREQLVGQGAARARWALNALLNGILATPVEVR
ncbi:TetR/AcrR family transcriptional regulator [Nocardia caishijiensis]|uniref:TetR family transcriptional regulator n=1 Tax=Nocardia caishijiensis TaxID=184756 RepID=A0ABQ6YJJ9_9NOCA|nr:TetR/AcrR family transcriptional regulator C-terminal domain-containing protein [Nocardia caishijiensis]KAF0845886.1 TetR family transcriptional regulator [Nocardia caishijiensis]